MANRVTMSICGTEYILVAEEDAAYMEKIGNMVDAEMQKLMGKKQFDQILGDLIVKPQGKPTLVPVTDKRPAMNVTNANNEFKQED